MDAFGNSQNGKGRLYPVADNGVSRPEFGLRASAIRSFTIDLSSALSKKKIEIGGSFLWAYDATDNSASVSISFAEELSDEGITFKSGTSIGGVQFNRIFVTAAAQAGKSISFLYAVEDPERGGIRIDNPAGDFSSVSLTAPTGSTLSADTTVTAGNSSTIAANANRTRLVIEADPSNSDYLRVGPTGVPDDTHGLMVPPGGQQTIYTTEAIDVYNETTAAADVVFRYFEEEV